MQNADSVILISHILTREYTYVIYYEKGDTRNKVYEPFLLNRAINQKIIIKKVLLNKTNIAQLVNILKRPLPKFREITVRDCDEPHNSILIYKKAKFSYLDICFDCLQIHSSKNLNFSGDDMDLRKWKQLEDFFKRFQVRYTTQTED